MSGTDFEGLNEAANKIYFKNRVSGEPVYLDLEGQYRVELAAAVDVPEDELEQYIGLVVESTLTWDKPNIYSVHKKRLDMWSAMERRTAPPFTGLLLALSIAAERMRQDENHSSNNYYFRLFELLGINDDHRSSKVRMSGKHTYPFWQGLNLWLADNDYRFGSPTARPVNSWKYVSYALSQALVREGDRKRFHRLFTQFALSPGEKLSEAEMGLYLDEWMTGNDPSQWLKKLWTANDLQIRVASAACQELEIWDGDDSEDLGPGKKNLYWICYAQKFPKKRLRLFLTGGASQSQKPIGLNVSTGSSPSARRAFESCPGGCWLAPLEGTDIAAVGPYELLPLDALLMSSVRLESAAGRQVSLSHDARPIMPMAMLEGNAYYREVARASLHITHMVICHESWFASVNDHLESYARHGFTKTLPGDDPSLPDTWGYFSSVEFLTSPQEDVHDSLQCITPLAGGPKLTFTGGIQLARNIWHRFFLPDLVASDEDGLLPIEVRSLEIGKKGAVLYESPDDGLLNPSILRELDLESIRAAKVHAVRGASSVSEAEIHLRSARYPRPIDPTFLACSVLTLDGNFDRVLSAITAPANMGEPSLKLSGYVPEEVTPIEADTSWEGWDPVGELNWQEQERSEEVSEYESPKLSESHLDNQDTISESCIVRGHHYWLVPESASTRKKQYRPMRCKDCGSRVLSMPPRGRSRKTSKQKLEERRHRRSTWTVTESEQLTVDPNVILDAIFYMGGGNWPTMEKLLLNVVDEPWHAAGYTQRLSDLGHIEVVLREETFKPKTWCVVPPTLLQLGSKKACWAGFWSIDTSKAINETLDKLGANKVEHLQENYPSSFVWEFRQDVDWSEVASSLQPIKDPHGRSPVIVEDLPATIAHALPHVTGALSSAKKVHFENSEDLEFFDPHYSSWGKSKLRKAGAYRTSFAGTRYFYYQPDVGSHLLPYEIVKLLSAREDGLRLHRYDEGSREFVCLLGCEPPGLFRRALVACSGRLPEQENGLVVYKDVPPNVGKQLLYKLYS